MVYYEIFLYLFYSLKLQHRITQRTSFSAKADNKKKQQQQQQQHRDSVIKKSNYHAQL